MSNFDFLKDINNDLFKLAQEAEKLFRDGYFEQCMTQTRRFGENICRLVIADRALPSDSFDEMLATLKDTPSPSEQEKEFLDDLYFLKKAGNTAVHSLKCSNDADAGKNALECLERTFETAINYAVFKCNADKKILSLAFDEELLMTGKKSKAASLQEKYVERKQKEQSTKKTEPKKSKKKSKKTNLELYEEYLEAKKERSKKFKNKPLAREIIEVIIACGIIYLAYILFFN